MIPPTQEVKSSISEVSRMEISTDFRRNIMNPSEQEIKKQKN